MEQWTDTAIVLGARPHGENGAVVSVLTQERGRHAGYVYGARTSRLRGVLEPGGRVTVHWRARVADQLGAFDPEPEHGAHAALTFDPLRLSALLSACALCDAALPEREGHPGLFAGLEALIDALPGPHWGASYVYWEIALLRELGFGLDLARCAGGGDPATLEWVSPKSGRAVSAAAGAPYRDRLLPLPAFLKPGGGSDDPAEVLKGLDMTARFLEHWAFAQHTRSMPAPRLRFHAQFARSMEPQAPARIGAQA